METKHTPGPWNLTTVPFELRNTDDAATIYGPYNINEGACMVANISRSPGDDVATANAKLIAAAPELLAKLQKVTMMDYPTLSEFNHLRMELAEEIKKATP